MRSGLKNARRRRLGVLHSCSFNLGLFVKGLFKVFTYLLTCINKYLHFPCRVEKKHVDTLKPFMSYDTDGTTKTGCHLNDEDLRPDAKVYFVIRGTVENHLIKNRFMLDIHNSGRNFPSACSSPHYC